MLVLRLSALGDIIHTLPAVRLLRDALPDTRLGWVVEAPYRELIEIVAPVDEVFTVATKRWRREPLLASTRSAIAGARRDLARFAEGQTSVDFQGLIKSALMGSLSGASVRYGFAAPVIRERLASLFINRPLNVNPGIHIVEINSSLARAVTGSNGETPHVDLTDFCSFSRVISQRFPEGGIVLNPGAGQSGKMWPSERFAQLARLIRRELGAVPMVVWGPGEKTLAERICLEGDAVLAPETNLRELAFLLRQARLVVSGDSGPLHLAAALGTKVLGLYGPTSVARNGPWGQPGHCVESPGNSKLMDSIRVEIVFQKIKELLN
ncbi:MAG TPA: lipopolysaccharide heptosyltransferase I [Thermoanaerobaculia bacterium]|nr:lipopolysaccharide heptosyltransferase I [Thermoanaerobaculia bacterium]